MALGSAVTVFEAVRADAARRIRGAIEALENHFIILENLQKRRAMIGHVKNVSFVFLFRDGSMCGG